MIQLLLFIISVCNANQLKLQLKWREDHKTFYKKLEGYKETKENGCWKASEPMKFISPDETTPITFEQDFCDVHIFETEVRDTMLHGRTQRIVSVFDPYAYADCKFDRVMRWMVNHIHEYSVFYDSTKAREFESEQCFVRVDFGSDDPRSPNQATAMQTLTNIAKGKNTMNLNANVSVSPWQAKCLNGEYKKINGEVRCKGGKNILGHQIKQFSNDPAANVSKLMNPISLSYFKDMREFSLQLNKEISMQELVANYVLPHDAHYYNIAIQNCYLYTDKLWDSLKENGVAKTDNEIFDATPQKGENVKERLL